MHTVLGAADALGEPLAAVVGNPAAYYAQFGFRPSAEYNIAAPVAGWQPYFQVRLLSQYVPSLRGTFLYPEPFSRI